MARGEFSYRSLHGAPRGRRKLLYVTVLVLVVLGIDFVSHGAVRAQVRALGSALWSASASARTIVSGSGFFSSRSGLAKENAALRAQLVQHEERASQYEAMRVENESLRSLLALSEREVGITAPVVSSFRTSPYGTFHIRAGADDGVRSGDLVLTPGGFVIGRIDEVSGRTALVRMIFASGSETEVVVANTSVVAEGRGGGNARILAPRSIAIATGTPVVSSSLGNRAVGIVGHVASDPARAEQTVYISLPVDIAALRFVYVVPLR